MRGFRHLSALILLLLLSPSCGEKGGVNRETIPLVIRILEDRDCEEAGLIEYASDFSRDADIYLLGKSYFCNGFAVERIGSQTVNRFGGNSHKSAFFDNFGSRLYIFGSIFK